MFTLLRNRIGDGLILIFFGFLIFDFSSVRSLPVIFLSYIFLILFISFTKRAQVPISAWLPAAIAAPTPVRALVHSSTLVTAGVIIIIKFYFILSRINFQLILLFFGLITVLIAGLSALIEIDFKKIVALSTLRQIGLLIFILGIGIKWFCFFHLISHAFFKRSLFLIVGRGLHFIFSQQDYRFYSSIFNFRLFNSLVLFICLLCLCGLFFSRGFISKDLFVDLLNNKNISIIFLIIFLLRLILTFFYSIRLIICIFKKSFVGVLNYIKFFYYIELSSFFLIIFSLIFSYWIINNYLFFFRRLVLEKKILLIFLFLYFLINIFLIKILSLIKRIFLLDHLKKIFFEKLKWRNKIEKSFLDKIILYIFYFLRRNFLKILNFNKNKNILLFFLLLFFLLFCF